MDDDSSSKFIESLTKFLQSLCNGYVEFNRGVELVGHIYLNIDTGEKVDYVLHEKVSKNDENSVTFVSNSFHALAKEREGKTGGAGANASKTANPRSASDDDDDILILDQPDSGMVGSTNSGTLSSRGVKRPAPGGSDQRRPGPPMHRGHGSSMGRQPGPWRNRQQAGPSATTVSSENMSQGNLSIGEVKLEQISSDELLSLASHVDGTSSQGRVGSGAQSDHGSFSPNDAPGQGWIKQEPTDENQRGLDTGWSQSDSSNSGSNLYPVMMHQNSSGYTSSAPVHGFSPTGAASSRHSFGQSLPGTSSASPFASPMPGTSQNMGGMDPSVMDDSWRLACRIGSFLTSASPLGCHSSTLGPAALGVGASRLTAQGVGALSAKMASQDLGALTARLASQDVDVLSARMTAAEKHRLNSRMYWRRLRQDPERRRLYNMRKAMEWRRRKEKQQINSRQRRDLHLSSHSL